MEAGQSEHAAAVARWLERSAGHGSPEQLCLAFEHGFAALWDRAHVTLGDVTLAAIASRVLWVAGERFPALSGLRVDATGLVTDRLGEMVAALPREQRADAVRFVLVEFLTLLGRLTAEILSRPLHDELAKLPVPPVTLTPARGEHGEASES